MQGLLNDLPLLGVLELIHGTRQSGVLELQAAVPATVAFAGGEIVSCGILDWLGEEALHATPLSPTSGSFAFTSRRITGQPLGPFTRVTTDWARANDEWTRICSVIGSPSQSFRGALPGFDGPDGQSVRSAARLVNAPLLQVAQVVERAVLSGTIQPIDRREWFRLQLNPAGPEATLSPVERHLRGDRTLGEAVQAGLNVAELRTYLLSEFRLGLRFPGSGWILRDLVWEQQFRPA